MKKKRPRENGPISRTLRPKDIKNKVAPYASSKYSKALGYPAFGPEKKNMYEETALHEVGIQRVPTLRAFWDLEKTVLNEIRVSGTVVSPLLTRKSPTCTYKSQKPW